MNISFNNYKGFLFGSSGNNDNKIDIKDHLNKLNSSVSNKNHSRKKNTEFKTDGFDALNLSWSKYEYIQNNNDTEDETSIEKDDLGTKLRNLSYKTNHELIQDDELSSHTTIYGQDLNSNLDESMETELTDTESEYTKENMNENNEATKEKSKSKSKSKKKKLTPDEKKELRKQAREMKKNAKLEKKQKKFKLNSEDLDLYENQPLVGSKSKMKHLKELLNECIKILSKNVDDLTDNSKIYQLDDVSLYLSDLRNLLDDEWLSDSNISWVFSFIYHGYLFPLLKDSLKNSRFFRYQEEKEIFISPICLLLPTFTFLIANSPDPEDLISCKVLPPNLSDSQFIFCPLNDNDDFASSEGGSHWSLVLFCKLQSLDSTNNKKEYIQKVFVYDSMFEANLLETKRLVQNMSKILYDTNDSKSTLDWDIINIRDSPQQTNNSDCGVYVTSVTAFLLSQLIALIRSSSIEKDSFCDLSLRDLRFNAIDSRIWMLSTLLNSLKSTS